MNTYLYNVGLFSIFIGLVLYVVRGRKRSSAEVVVEGFGGIRGRIKGVEGFVLVALGLLLMAAASWI